MAGPRRADPGARRQPADARRERSRRRCRRSSSTAATTRSSCCASPPRSSTASWCSTCSPPTRSAGRTCPPSSQAMVRAWQETILGIAKEEMGHLVTVQNLLTALRRPAAASTARTIPHDTVLYPSGFRLQPLSLAVARDVRLRREPGRLGAGRRQAREIKAQARLDDRRRRSTASAGSTRSSIAVIGDAALVADGTFDATSDAVPGDAGTSGAAAIAAASAAAGAARRGRSARAAVHRARDRPRRLARDGARRAAPGRRAGRGLRAARGRGRVALPCAS